MIELIEELPKELQNKNHYMTGETLAMLIPKLNEVIEELNELKSLVEPSSH